MKSLHYFLVNLILAIIWIILAKNPSMLSFLIGFGLGFLILMLFQRSLKSQRYISKVKGLFWFCLLFLKAFLKANLNVAKIILFVPKKHLHPAFLNYPIQQLTHFEIILLSQLITLTPGTISVSIAKDFSHLRIHVLDLHQEKATIQEIDLELKDPMLRFTR